MTMPKTKIPAHAEDISDRTPAGFRSSGTSVVSIVVPFFRLLLQGSGCDLYDVVQEAALSPRTPGNQSRRFPPSGKADGSPFRYGDFRTASCTT